MNYRYLRELKDFTTCQKVLDAACLGSQSAMDTIIENLVYFNNKYLLFNDQHSHDQEQTIKLFLKEYEHGYDEYSSGVDPHPQLIYMHAISSSSKFYDPKKLKEFFSRYILRMYVPIQNFASIGPYGNYSPLFNNLNLNYLDKLRYVQGLIPFIFKTELNKYVQKIYFHHDDREKNHIYTFEESRTFSAKLREYLMDMIGVIHFNSKLKYSFISSLDNTYRIFIQLINCKVINKQFTFDAFDTFYYDYRKINIKTTEDEYEKEDTRHYIQGLKKLYLRIIILKEIMRYNNGDDLTHFGKHFVASSLAIVSVLKEFFNYNEITPLILENKKISQIFKDNKIENSNNFPSNFKSFLFNFIKLSLDDYSSITKQYPELDIYLRSYLKPVLVDGHNLFLDYDEIDKICNN